jgi:hypothetical protein
LLVRIGPDASYLVDVLPAVTLLGLGLAVTVAPLTATVLAAAEDRYAGIASATNNAVARTGGLLAVAALPALVGLTGDDYRSPGALDSAFDKAMWVSVALLVAGAAVSWIGVRDPHEPPPPPPPQCGVGAPTLGERRSSAAA